MVRLIEQGIDVGRASAVNCKGNFGAHHEKSEIIEVRVGNRDGHGWMEPHKEARAKAGLAYTEISLAQFTTWKLLSQRVRCVGRSTQSTGA
jgi:hypothetical protein